MSEDWKVLVARLEERQNMVEALAGNLVQAYIEVAATLEVLVSQVMRSSSDDERKTFHEDFMKAKVHFWEAISSGGVSGFNDLDPETKASLERLVRGEN